eukprot:1757912-Rhodomonas_salina.3
MPCLCTYAPADSSCHTSTWKSEASHVRCKQDSGQAASEAGYEDSTSVLIAGVHIASAFTTRICSSTYRKMSSAGDDAATRSMPGCSSCRQNSTCDQRH